MDSNPQSLCYEYIKSFIIWILFTMQTSDLVAARGNIGVPFVVTIVITILGKCQIAHILHVYQAHYSGVNKLG